MKEKRLMDGGWTNFFAWKGLLYSKMISFPQL